MELLIHDVVDIDRHVAGKGADIDRAAATPQRPETLLKGFVRRTGPERVDVGIDTAGNRAVHPLVDRTINRRERRYTLRAYGFHLVKQAVVSSDTEDIGCPHRERAQRHTEAQSPADPVDQDGGAGAD